MKYISLLFTCLFMVSCGNAQEATNTKEQEPLTGTYRITAVNSNETFSEDLILTFNIAKQMVSGFSGCNQFSGSYTSNGNSLNFGPMAATRKMCRPEVNTLEQHILKALKASRGFSKTKNSVIFINQEGTNVLTLKKSDETTNKTTDNSIYQVEYTAISRGFFMQITYENNSITYQKNRNNKPTVKSLTESEVQSLDTKITALNLNSLKKLEAPSKAHQYDGAAIASLRITKNETAYQTPSFDHGKPPKAINSLVTELLALIEKP